MVAGAEPSSLAEQELVELVLRAGLLMARSGAAAFRVRETMGRIAGSLGASGCEAFVSTDVIQVAIRVGQSSASHTVRVAEIGVNMWRLSEVDRLSRELLARRTADPGVLRARLDAIEAAPPQYPRLLTGVTIGAACGAFCAGMGGTAVQIIAAFVGAALGHALRLRFVARRVPIVTMVSSCSLASCVIAFVVERLVRLGPFVPAAPPGAGAGKAVLASVLYLIPGVPLVTSLIDLIHFDLVSGLARGAFAGLVVACIGVGVLVFLSIAGHAQPW